MASERKKQFNRSIAYIALRTFTALHNLLSLKGNYAWGKFLGTAVYSVLPHHRKTAMDSLAVAFPNASVKDRKKISKDFFIFMAQSGLEMLYYLRHQKELNNVRIEGEQHLRAALAQKRGVVMVSAHIGNFPLMGLKLAQEGFPVNFVMRPMRDPKAGAYIQGLRDGTGVKTIYSYPRKECVNGILKALRNNEIVIIQMDQNFGTNGVWVKFFNELAATPTGPIVFAMRTNALIVPAYIYCEGAGKHCIVIEPGETLIEKEDKDEMVLVNVAKFTRIMENWIRLHPHQWGWIHKRWKSRPDEKALKEKFIVEK